MNEIPERIEREMFEIRSRMAPDVQDLRQHVEPKAVGERVKRTARQRLREVVSRFRGNLRAKQQGFVNAAKSQMNLAREAGRKRNPSTFTDAVKSDPRPMALLAIVLAITLLTARRISNGRGE